MATEVPTLKENYGGGREDDELMDHVALEAMHAMSNKDKSGFLSAMRCLMTSLRDEMDQPEMEKE